MQNVVLSTKNVDDLINEIANEVVRKLEAFGTNQKEQSDKLLTIDEVADFLSVKKQTIYQKVSRREIPFMKKGKRLYFSKKEITEYIESGKVTDDQQEPDACEYLLKKKGGINE